MPLPLRPGCWAEPAVRSFGAPPKKECRLRRCSPPALSPGLSALSLGEGWRPISGFCVAYAHDLLAEVYTWFTEGFDTADLQEAKALLEELA